MKYLFLGTFLVLMVLSVTAGLWRPRDDDPRIPIVWATDDNPVRREQIALFNERNSEYRVVLDPANAMPEKVIVQSLAGVGPDVFDCYNGFQLTAFVRSGIAMDITEEMTRRGVRSDETWPSIWPHTLLDGRIYAHAGNTNANAMWFNKRLFREAGVPFPEAGWTWEECIELAKALTQRDARGRPYQFGLTMDKSEWRYSLLGQWGGNIYSPEGTRCMLDSPEAQDAMQFFADLIHVHRVLPTATEEASVATAGGWGTGATALFAAGRVAMAAGGRWWLCILRHEDYRRMELGAVVLPKGPSSRIFGGGRASLVNRFSPNRDAALAFVAFMHSPEWNALINRQADAIGPVIRYHYGEYEADFLHNPEHPEEDYNLTWRNAVENAEPEYPSPFVNGYLVDRILEKHTDMMREGMKSGRQAMIDSAREVNQAIIETLKLDPKLRQQYEALIAQGAPAAWDSNHDAPKMMR